MGRFSKRTTTQTTNLAGGKAFSMNKEMELIHAVLTTFLNDKFYETGADRLTRIQALIRANSPEFVARLAVVARTEFHLRSVSHVLLGELAKVHRGDSLVMRAIVKCAERPDDLIELAAYVGMPMPKQVKRGIRHALPKFSRYQLAKYRGEGKSVSLVDIFNLSHPNPKFASDEQKAAWKDLMAGKLASFDTWEVDISKNPSKEAWEKLIVENKMGYMAMLRNLNNFVKYGVDPEKVVAKLTDPEAVKKSKQLPFRFYTAYKNVTGARIYSDAIARAMDIAVDNVPKFEGKTLIAVDSSGSMTSGDDNDNAIVKAAIFAATLMKANINADVILYDTGVKEFPGTSLAPVVDIADRIIHAAMGGGTETSLVFEYALKVNRAYDRIIILSDNESWHEGYGGVQERYNAYKRATNSDPFIYAVDIQGYGTKDVEGSKVFHLTGWSDRLLDFMAQAERGDSLVKYIKGIEL
jgi:60 kDa SS-A/Ro ribonucleoprotein